MGKWLACISAIALFITAAQGQNRTQALKPGHAIEFTGEYLFSQFRLASTVTNMNGAIGAVGVNLAPWLQLRADASVAYGQLGTTRIRIYANHFGPRFFFRKSNDLHAMPFAEVLFGGSRLDARVSGSGYSTADNGFSMKAGGGVDFDLSPHFAVRAVDMDYYRTPFLGAHQNNLWVSTGIVWRFGGGRP